MTKETLYSAFGVESEILDTKTVPLSAVAPMGTCTDTEPDPGFIFDLRILKRVLKNISKRTPLWLWGPAGCGKTELVIQIGARLRRPVRVISCGEETSVRELLGTYELVPDGIASITQYRPGALAKALCEELTIIVLDEANMAAPGIAAQLNRLLETGRIENPETGETVEAANGVTFVATANTSGAMDDSGLYAGSQLQNGATRNRFAGLKLGYMNEEMEVKLLAKAFPDADTAVAVPEADVPFTTLAVRLANGCRTLVEEGAVGLPFSIRTIKMFTEATLLFRDLREGFADAYYDLLTPPEATAANEVFHRVFGVRMDN